ncbi:translocation protein sec62 [Phakopsora pachyrhizi]|uniref:Translocation protein SEC62 n=1 Tax=Phakopsora pachyrhizi TaxID=170000 RepID=A0AAV0AE51_PHAPC|nr:translocation protein sec62 [Phakopsora pachyrhizi]CAH7665797.1 translocation protein sec62 [Phakopsora pachyrhizi]
MDRQKQIPADLLVVVQYLRSKAEVKTKTGVLEGKRHEYFKGKSMIKALLSPSYSKIHPKSLPEVKDEESAIKLIESIVPYTFFLRVHRTEQSLAGAKILQIYPEQIFKSDEYYAWLYDSNQWTVILGAVLMVVIVLAGVMFPLWPMSLRIGVWYLSMAALGLVGLFFGIAIVRLIIYIITWIAVSPGIWLFPNLFEDVGFVDSFIPLWGWDIPPPKKIKKTKAQKAAEKEQKKANKKSKQSNTDSNNNEEPAVNEKSD